MTTTTTISTADLDRLARLTDAIDLIGRLPKLTDQLAELPGQLPDLMADGWLQEMFGWVLTLEQADVDAMPTDKAKRLDRLITKMHKQYNDSLDIIGDIESHMADLTMSAMAAASNITEMLDEIEAAAE